jgi:Fe-S oxidoreductase
VLWPDSFTNSLAPHVAESAVTVLEAAGFTVRIPDRTVCCGLTWISTGQLRVARRVLARSLDALAADLNAGRTVVGLEPSCASVLREDAKRLFGDDPRRLDLAGRLAAQTVTLAELLDRDAPDFTPRLATADSGRPKAIVQTHCHQHATLGVAADDRVLAAWGIDADRLKSGCCGLAGDFGMSPAHRDVSFACAEQVLYPAVRAADAGTLVLADGFSCRLQIASGDSGRRGVHLAEVLAAAVRGEKLGPTPERQVGT